MRVQGRKLAAGLATTTAIPYSISVHHSRGAKHFWVPAMQLNLRDADSIVSWWAVFPARHQGALEQMLQSRPQFGQAIRAAQRRIAASQDLQAMLNRSLAQHDEHLAQMSARRDAMSSVEMLRRDMAMAA